MITLADFDGDPACVRPRCGRSEAEHLDHDRGEYDETRWRIWRALGFPCSQFTDEYAVLAGDQAATSRWGRRPGPATARPARGPDTASQGAALARQLLARKGAR